jgi:Na+/H+ antiporter NhaD/arsenite permease-like protein
MVATLATSQQDGIWLVIAAVAYIAYRLLSSARTEERRRREQGQPHTIRDSALLLLAALSVVGVLLCAIFLKPLNVLVHSRAGFAAIIVLVGGGLTYLFNRRRAPHS